MASVIPSAFFFQQQRRFSSANAWIFIEMEPLYYRHKIAPDGAAALFKCHISVLDRTDAMLEHPRNPLEVMNQLFQRDGCAVAFVQGQQAGQLVPDVVIRMPPAAEEHDFVFGIRDGKWKIGFGEHIMRDVVPYHRWPNHWQRTGVMIDKVIVDNLALMQQMVTEQLALLIMDEFYPLPHAVTLQDVQSQIEWHLDPAKTDEFLWMAQLTDGVPHGLAVGYYSSTSPDWPTKVLLIDNGQLFDAAGALVLSHEDLGGTRADIVRCVASALGRVEAEETRKRSATSRWAIEGEQIMFDRRQSRPPRKIYDPDTVHHTKKKKRAMASQKQHQHQQ